MIRHKQKMEGKSSPGFTLMEVVLSLAIAGSIALVGVHAMKGWAQSEKAAATANYMKTVGSAIEDMFKGPRNFEVLYSLADINGGAVQIPVYTNNAMAPISVMYGIKAAAGASGTIPGSPALARVSAAMNPLKDTMTLVVARAGTPGERVLHAALVSTGRAPENIVRKAASLVGGGGGYVSAVPPANGTCVSACTQTIQSAFGEWQTDINVFAGTAWEGQVSAAPPSITDGAYLVVYRHISEDEVEGDYLYRTQIPGNADANRMYIPMDMAGSSIVGADNVFVGGDLTVRESLSAQGHANLAGDLGTSEMVVDGSVFAGTITVSRSFVSDPAKIDESELPVSGNFLVDGPVATVYAGADQTISGTVKIKDFFQDSAAGSISANSIALASLQNVKGSFEITGTSHIGNLVVKDTLSTDHLLTDSVTADTIEAIDTMIDRDLKIEGDLNTTDPVVIKNAAFDVTKSVVPTYKWTQMQSCDWVKVSFLKWEELCDKAKILDTANPGDVFTLYVGDLLPDGSEIVKIKKSSPNKGVYINRGGTEIRLGKFKP
ncbi:MAG: prepilin-type N-terminal cleavage/methylation domain-containing protein [Rhodospirillales bacterium]|nr:prepilin-type N-terminal cleavage/methylation domain-containing protein [Rhodospirillales bacterium]